MEIEQSSLRLVLGLASLSLALGAGRLAAQAPSAESLTVARIADEADRENTLPRSFAWSPDGKTLSFIRTAARAPQVAHGPVNKPIPASEIWGVDAATGQQKLLVSSADLASALGEASRPPNLAEDSEASVQQRQLHSYAWAPSGHALLLATGASLALFNLDSHTSRLIVKDGEALSNPEISPNGRFISFVQGHALWLANAESGKPRPFAARRQDGWWQGEPDWAYRNELGLSSAYWWSPDSASIAWLETDDRAVDKYSLRNSDGEQRQIAYPKPGGAIPAVHLFVRGISPSKTLQVELGKDINVYIPRVQWLPDGKHLAIERLSRDQKTLDLLLADAATGKARVILTEKDAYWINLNDDLHFLKDSHRFLWASERTGYRHLYLYDTTGLQLAQLTHGDWEVTSLVGADEKTGSVYFTATEASPLERQVYRVGLDGADFTRVTHEKGTHDPKLSPGGDRLVDTWSDHATPPRHYLLRSDGTTIASIGRESPKEAAPAPLLALEFLTIKSHMGQEMNAWIMRPPGFDSARHYPVILYTAGGPGEQAVLDAWGGDKSLWFALMAQKGYIVFALDNRGTAGRGHLFEEPIHLRFSGSEMADLRDAILYLHAQPWVDKGRIGICGWGYGGFLAIHGMLDRPLSYRAGFAGSAVVDWHLYDAVFAERYLEDPVRNQDGWLASSAIENAKNLNAPLLLAQATLDERVHLENPLMLLDELLDKGKYADILLFPDRQGEFGDKEERSVLYEKLTDFFLKNL